MLPDAEEEVRVVAEHDADAEWQSCCQDETQFSAA